MYRSFGCQTMTTRLKCILNSTHMISFQFQSSQQRCMLNACKKPCVNVCSLIESWKLLCFMYLCTGWHWKSASSLLRVFPTIFFAGLSGYVACSVRMYYANYAFDWVCCSQYVFCDMSGVRKRYIVLLCRYIWQRNSYFMHKMKNIRVLKMIH